MQKAVNEEKDTGKKKKSSDPDNEDLKGLVYDRLSHVFLLPIQKEFFTNRGEKEIFYRNLLRNTRGLT